MLSSPTVYHNPEANVCTRFPPGLIARKPAEYQHKSRSSSHAIAVNNGLYLPTCGPNTLLPPRPSPSRVLQPVFSINSSCPPPSHSPSPWIPPMTDAGHWLQLSILSPCHLTIQRLAASSTTPIYHLPIILTAVGVSAVSNAEHQGGAFG